MPLSALRSYYLASSAVRSYPWAARRRCCLATQPRCPGSWRSRPCRHCSHRWRHWAGSLLCCARKCCWLACSWPTCTWIDLGRKEKARGVWRMEREQTEREQSWRGWLVNSFFNLWSLPVKFLNVTHLQEVKIDNILTSWRQHSRVDWSKCERTSGETLVNKLGLSTVHKIHGSVQYHTVVSRYGMFLIQQKVEMPVKLPWFLNCMLS